MHTKLQIVAGTKTQTTARWGQDGGRWVALARRKVHLHPKGKPRHAAFIASEAYLAHLMRRIMGNAIKCPLTWQLRSFGQHSGAREERERWEINCESIEQWLYYIVHYFLIKYFIYLILSLSASCIFLSIFFTHCDRCVDSGAVVHCCSGGASQIECETSVNRDQQGSA